jgi:hypothetical protein
MTLLLLVVALAAAVTTAAGVPLALLPARGGRANGCGDAPIELGESLTLLLLLVLVVVGSVVQKTVPEAALPPTSPCPSAMRVI